MARHSELKEYGYPKWGTNVTKELAFTSYLNYLKEQGYHCVEIRGDGTAYIYYCMLCCAPCYGQENIDNHLKGRKHIQSFASAQSVLLKDNPFPFNDGVHFVFYSDPDPDLDPDPNQIGSENGVEVISGVLQGNVIKDLTVKWIGSGRICAKFFDEEEYLHRIWCEWIGKRPDRVNETFNLPNHDFAIITFYYECDLGKGLFEEEGYSRKRASESGESSSRSPESDETESSLEERIVSMKKLRSKLRKTERKVSERKCALCKRLLLKGKDVGTLMNMKTKRLACSSRNLNGNFHIFHVSCLIHWLLLCEMDVIAKDKAEHEASLIPKQNKKRKYNKKKDKYPYPLVGPLDKIYFCSDCQGTGIEIQGEFVESVPVPLSKIYESKLKDHIAHKAWKVSPEELDDCATGFCFPPQTPIKSSHYINSYKLLPFYRAIQETKE